MIQTNRMISVYDAWRNLAANIREAECVLWELSQGKRTLGVWPMFWLGGVLMNIINPIIWESIPVLLPLDVPRPTPGVYLDEMLQKVKVHGVSMPPSALKELCKNAEYLERVKKLEWVSYAGAPLEQETGDLLVGHTNVHAAYGSTETGGLPVYIHKYEPRDWRYYKFHPASGFRMEQQPGDSDLYEMVIDRKKELADYQFVFDQFPDLDVWHMNDLFRRHPEKEDLWLYSGRKDDFIKLAHLTKFHGLDVEEIVERHAKVHRALVGGDAQDSPFLLVEVEGTTSGQEEQSMSDEGRARALDEIWRMIDREVNDVIKIKKEMIIMVDRPLRLTGKGTVDRRGTLLEFKGAVDELYARAASKHE
jgi:acyl-coenzyme A synthetase/AMP-(fatty) acid ligase